MNNRKLFYKWFNHFGVLFIILLVVLSFFFIYKKIFANKIELFESARGNRDPWDNIDIIYYINLEHRKDRNDEILSEFKKMDIPSNKIVRIDAVRNKERGAIGCSKSHIKTIETFLQSDYKNCIVFEDDFQFSEDSNTTKTNIQNLFDEGVDFDICMISGNTIKDEPSQYPFLNKIIDSQTTSGYIVSKSFAPKLLENYKEGCEMFEKTLDEPTYAVDQYWKHLQPISKWYIFNPKLGIQRPSYSDIVKQQTDYGV